MGEEVKEYGQRNSGECSIEGCQTKAHAKGICMTHYSRARSGKNLPKVCTKEGCNKKVAAKGLCGSHYRYKRNMDKIWRS